MENTNKKFDKLFNLIDEHLKEKKYLYKPNIYFTYDKEYRVRVDGKVIIAYTDRNTKKDVFKEDSIKIYTDELIFKGKNELGNEIDRRPNEDGEIVLKKGEAVVDRDGKIVFSNVTPTDSKNVLLSIAFSMAIENYNNIRPQVTEEKKEKIKEDISESKLDLTDMSDILLRYFSNKYYKTIDDLKPKEDHSPQENDLININQDFEYENIEKFREVEYKLHATVDTLRNYHSHFVHEPTILSFEDYFQVDSKLSKTELEDAKNWFKKRFKDAQEHLLSSLQTRLNLLNSDEQTNLIKTKGRIKQLEEVIEDFKHLYFLNKDDKLSLNGQLFIACMFLYKRQAKIILERWRKVKEPQGYQNTLHTFYTYYSLSERYSLQNFSDPLLKFRDITSKLSNIPSSTNPQMQFIYHKIKELNENTYVKIEKDDELNELNNKKVKLQNSNKNHDWVDRKIAGINNLGFDLKDTKKLLKKAKEELKVKKMFIDDINNTIQDYTGKARKIAEKNIKKTLREIQPIEEKIKELEQYSVRNEVIPIRKRHILTPILLQYLLDNKLFSDKMEIAIKKTPSDRIKYFEDNEYINIKTDNLVEIKNRKKILKTKIEKNPDAKLIKEYNALKENFKELKRNFVYKTPKELEKLQEPSDKTLNKGTKYEKTITEVIGFRFAVKTNNAQVLYKHNDNVIIPLTLSPDLLLKWVFIHLNNSTNGGRDSIVHYIENHIKRLLENSNDVESVVKDFIINRYDELRNLNLSITELVQKYKILDQKNYPNSLNLNNVFPRHIMDVLNLRPNKISNEEKVANRLKVRITNLKNFKDRNLKYDKPFTKESKEKIDTILEFIHFSLLYDVYQNNIHKKTEYDEKTFIRKTYFNISSYNVAREYFRFYGRYENNTILHKEDFVRPERVKQLKNLHKHCFNYIETDIAKSKSLEKLFNAVIDKFIIKLIDLQTNYNSVSNINKILKIDTEESIDKVNENLKLNFLDHLALGHNVISVKDVLKDEWKGFENNRANKLKKGNNFSDFSFIRRTLENTDNGKLKTNIDYIFQVILPQTDEIKNNKGKIKPTVFNKLLKMKTEELILWNIAKSYRANFNISDIHNDVTKNTDETFQLYSTFNKAYKMDLEYTIVIDKDTFWKDEYNKQRFSKVIESNQGILNKTLKATIKVPAKRYDNKFLKVESELIKEYLLWNHYNAEKNEIIIPKEYKYYMLNSKMEVDSKTRTYKLQEFDDLMKVIYRDLKMSLTYIGEILRAEKKLLQISDNNMDIIKTLLQDRYLNEKPIRSFFLPFKKIKNAFKDKSNNQLIYVSKYISQFRNNALHYQLQDPERKKDIIKLLRIINGELANATEEEFTRIER